MAVIKKIISNITSGINEVKPGEYRDYRGNQYTVIGIAKDTETGYDAVVYTRADGQMFVMPVEIFLSKIIYNNQRLNSKQGIKKSEKKEQSRKTFSAEILLDLHFSYFTIYLL